jgi:hypothetical protein
VATPALFFNNSCEISLGIFNSVKIYFPISKLNLLYIIGSCGFLKINSATLCLLIKEADHLHLNTEKDQQ